MKPTERQIEALRELINIGVGKGASVLNTMLNSHIVLNVPEVKILSNDELINELSVLGDGKLSAIDLKFTGEFSGTAQLLFPSETALIFVNTLVGESPVGMDFDSIKAGTLCEVGNVVLNGVMGSISNILKLRFNYSVPGYFEEKADALIDARVADTDIGILLAKTSFAIKELDITGNVVLFFEVGALVKLILAIDNI